MSKVSSGHPGTTKLPWFKFYPTDWRADAGLKLCSLGARGLWIEMLAIMHEAGGYLEINGKAVNTRALAALSGCLPEEITATLEELEQAGVFSRDRRGRIYSRRMLRDLKKAGLARSNGRKGGNPALRTPSPAQGASDCDVRENNGSVKGPDRQRDKQPDKPGDKVPVKAGLKTQKPEARVQKDKTPPAGGIKEGGAIKNLQAALAEQVEAEAPLWRDEDAGDLPGEQSAGRIWPELAEMTELLRDSRSPPAGSKAGATATAEPETETRPEPETRPVSKPVTSGKAGRGSRLDQDWQPSEDDQNFARERGMDDELCATEALRFRNYWTSLAGRRACKLDWHRTWQNWVLRALEPGSPGGSRNAGSFRSHGSFRSSGSRSFPVSTSPGSSHPHRDHSNSSRSHGEEPGWGGAGQGGGAAGAGYPGRGAGGRQRPGGFDLAEVAARLLDRAAAQDDLSERGGDAGTAGQRDPAA
ncbi:hypothetical protein O4H49_03310 [Kiloniella laminariae]|uniref:DUF1376 domain-containing protein n=1 Tax=Kiloniella laminariae TaxID=454162 RepID=A0ABT4LIG9_9PROT|nr:hypothetical protein [Kiloniella laminariae]MCZ4279792.1 hypothetical protein [Kiloniella laminariae]